MDSQEHLDCVLHQNAMQVLAFVDGILLGKLTYNMMTYDGL